MCLFQGVYQIINGTFDLSILKNLPIQGNRWTLKSTVIQVRDNVKSKLFCFETDASVSVGRRTRNKG